MLQLLLYLVLRHLERYKKDARLLFIDFCSAFNCIQPHVLAHRTSTNFNMDFGTACWLTDFITNRSQRVRINVILCCKFSSSTRFPQGCVLSPLLLVSYTNRHHI